MSYRAYSTPTPRSILLLRLEEVQRAVQNLRPFHPRLDPDEARATLEGLLDTMADWPRDHGTACADCDQQLPEYRIRHWTNPESGTGSSRPLCPSCWATRQDALMARVRTRHERIA